MLIGKYNAKYIGKTMCGFESKHEYIIDIGKDLYGYQINGIYDITDQDNSSALIRLSSEKSVKTYFEINKDITEI